MVNLFKKNNNRGRGGVSGRLPVALCSLAIESIHGSAHTRAHTHTHKHTCTRTHTVVKDKGSETLAELRRHVFKHNGSSIETRAGKNTHAHAQTAATLVQVRCYVFKHNGSAVDTSAG